MRHPLLGWSMILRRLDAWEALGAEGGGCRFLDIRRLGQAGEKILVAVSPASFSWGAPAGVVDACPAADGVASGVHVSLLENLNRLA